MPDNNSRSPVGMKLALIASALLAVAGLLAFWYASKQAQQSAAGRGDGIIVTIQDKVCKPNDITVPAGRTTFTIINKSDRALEWEILDGVMVVEERENIAPGFSQKLSVKLRPGNYDITCGLLSNPRGKLHVTASADSDAEDARPPAMAFLGPQAEYRVYLITQSRKLLSATQALADAIRAGELERARALYAPAHQLYKRIEPAALLFADLDQRINGRAAYFEKREADPGFTGFHRIEHALFAPDQGRLEGLAPLAGQLQADLGQLSERLRGLETPPELLAGSAGRMVRRAADNLPADGGLAYARHEASDLQGTLDGTRKLASLMSPLLAKAKPDLDGKVKQGFADFAAALDPWRHGEGFREAALDDAQRKAMAERLRALADDLDAISPALGL